MREVFAGLLFGYVAWALTAAIYGRIVPKDRIDIPSMVVQTPLFVLACWIGWRSGVFNRGLINPPAIILGVVLGHVVFGFSLLATHRVVRDAVTHFLDVPGLIRFLSNVPLTLFKYFGVAFMEELIYRAAAQPVLADIAGAWPAVIAVAAAFTLVHEHIYHNGLIAAAEFLAFALLLGVLYHVTGSLAFVTMVHVTRNLESVYLEYQVNVDETGDPEKARLMIEQPGREKPVESA